MDTTDALLLEILHGDGESAQTPVLFAPCNVRVRVPAERLFIERRFGAEGTDWTEEMHYTSMAGHSVWNLRMADGTTRSVYFDTENTTYDG
jgi:hypothetical protein